MPKSSSRLILAGLRGGSGKTTQSMGLIAALIGMGREVVPFKKGPDFIDTGWLALAAGRPCYNLDPFLMGNEATLRSLLRHASGCLALIEGNRGLFDGMDEKGTFSTAELAKLTRTPVILTVDCTMATRTVAAMVLGCMHFDPDVHFGGVILNRIRGSRHGTLIRRTVEQYTGLPVLGVVERLAEGLVPERHMGLVPPQEHPAREEVLRNTKNLAETSIDLEHVLALADSAPTLEVQSEKKSLQALNAHGRPRIGVIEDSAFWFYYPENLEALESLGAELVKVSALEPGPLPEIDALYIGGGFPETHAEKIASNHVFRDSLREAVEAGLPVYAECGGLMMLGEELVTRDGRFPMMGILPVRFQMKSRPQGHGYSILTVDKGNPFFPVGARLHGHEFHYSKPEACGLPLTSALEMERGVGCLEGRDGLVYRNVLALYTHIHAAGTPEWAEAMVRRAGRYRLERRRGIGAGCGAFMMAGTGSA
ncbi:MAG: cobyrinate a,c-diamide synthase [Deltaproteobacteria bacterium]|nr:cobyrinate a,c-diamide synthase [Deltaproteobacteria bacterium]